MISFQQHEHPAYSRPILTLSCDECGMSLSSVMPEDPEQDRTLQDDMIALLREDGCSHKVNHDR